MAQQKKDNGGPLTTIAAFVLFIVVLAYKIGTWLLEQWWFYVILGFVILVIILVKIGNSQERDKLAQELKPKYAEMVSLAEASNCCVPSIMTRKKDLKVFSADPDHVTEIGNELNLTHATEKEIKYLDKLPKSVGAQYYTDLFEGIVKKNEVFNIAFIDDVDEGYSINGNINIDEGLDYFGIYIMKKETYLQPEWQAFMKKHGLESRRVEFKNKVLHSYLL